MKRIIRIVVSLMMLLSLCACGGGQSYQEYVEERAANSQFEEIDEDSTGGGYIRIYRHKDTGVCYMYVRTGYGGGLTMMMNEDGTPYVK